MADPLRINGAQYDQGSTELKINNVPIYGYTAVSWAQKRERQHSTSTGKDRRPKGRNGGKMVYENLKITVRRETASQIKLLLADSVPDQESYGNAEVPVTFQYTEDESNQVPIMNSFGQCYIVSDGGNSE